MSCQICEQEPCTCQKQLEAQPKWIVRHCATPGCFTAIRMRLEQQDATPICKWCQAGESHALNGKAAVDSRLRLDELRYIQRYADWLCGLRTVGCGPGVPGGSVSSCGAVYGSLRHSAGYSEALF